MKHFLSWEVGHSASATQAPAQYVVATVPGAVQLDYQAAFGMPDYLYATNYKEYTWMEDVFWRYRTQIEVDLAPEERVYFVSHGIDYQFDILLDGQMLHSQEGMYTTVELDLTQRLRGGRGLLEVIIHPIPKRPGAEQGTRVEADQCCKPPASYSWDWHPRLVPTGIWEETYLEVRGRCYIADARLQYQLSDSLDEVQVQFTCETGAQQIGLQIWDPSGNQVYCGEGAAQDFVLPSPKLWWCNGLGKPNQYTWMATAQCRGEQYQVEGKVGFRRAELVMNPGSWDEPEQSPKSRSHPPITMRLNGVEVFCKGSNWVMPEIFYGATGPDVYQTQLKLAKDAHFNMLRCWGGANIDKESFFELCSEYGIMVWQEFTLSCNNYVGTDKYLAVLEQESRSILLKLRKYPCVVLWCGGNELFNNWSRMTDQSLALRLLDKLCYELDRDTPYIMTSPLDGMGHGCYLFVYPDGREVYEAMNQSRYTAYTECGVPSLANRESLLLGMPESDLFPVVPNKNTVAHHAFDAWLPGDTWCSIDTIERYFGPQPDLDSLIEKSQWLQSAGYQCIYEEARRQKPYCSMVLNWCYNEPWPCMANNSLLCFPSSPKAAYYAVADSCRPTLLSARFDRFSYRAGEWFEADLWLLNDSPVGVRGGKATAYVLLGDDKIKLLDWEYSGVKGAQNQQGPRVRLQLPHRDTDRLVFLIEAGDYSSVYDLVYRPTEQTQQAAVLGLNQ